MTFIKEVDKLKGIYRQTLLMDGSRRENDAEHSWHLAIMALLLSEHAKDKNIDILKVVKMVLVHDIVEIDAGDTYCYDDKAGLDKAEREIKSADRIFNILPQDQAEELMSLWKEFEERSTPESKFAASLDRLQPLFHNHQTEGVSWIEHGIAAEQVIERNKHIGESSEVLWDFAKEIIDDSVDKGYLKK